jgi:hypothetical protein
MGLFQEQTHQASQSALPVAGTVLVSISKPPAKRFEQWRHYPAGAALPGYRRMLGESGESPAWNELAGEHLPH